MKEHLEPASWRGTITRSSNTIARRSASGTVATLAVGWMAFCAILVIVGYPARAAGLVVFAVLRRAWVGPRVPDPFFATGVLLFLVPSLVIQARRSKMATRMLDSMIQQVTRAREQVASQASARAGELELLSSKLPHELKNPLASVKALIQVSQRTTRHEHRIQITVRDSGSGMAPDVLARVGTPFFTTRPQGTGLGVTLARNVFAQHGGSLEFDSTLGRGTVAVGCLPVGDVGDPSPITDAARGSDPSRA